jgi:hypothetical protein
MAPLQRSRRRYRMNLFIIRGDCAIGRQANTATGDASMDPQRRWVQTSRPQTLKSTRAQAAAGPGRERRLRGQAKSVHREPNRYFKRRRRARRFYSTMHP